MVDIDIGDIPIEYSEVKPKECRKYNWNAFQDKVEKNSQHHDRKFKLSSINEQAKLITDVLVKIANSTSNPVTILKENKSLKESRKAMKEALKNQRLKQSQANFIFFFHLS